MGEVYEVRDQLLNEDLAFKTLRGDLGGDPGVLRRFQSEIQLARKVTHPNVCRRCWRVGGFRRRWADSRGRWRTWPRRGRGSKSSRASKLKLRARLALGEAEIAAYRTHWPDALRLARQATGLNGGTDENIEAEMLAGLATIHAGQIDPGRVACEHAIRVSKEKIRPYLEARSKLSLGEALREKGRPEEGAAVAREAFVFFDSRRIWEAVWRCRVVLAGAPARTTLDEVKRLWPDEMVRSYLERPDLKKIALP